MKIIAIGGEPGSGKTTLMKRIISKFNFVAEYNSFKLVPYLKYNNIYILGKYEENEVFSGTDRMSMAVQPEAIKFLDFLPENSIVLYEGDRLFNNSFLENCQNKYELKIVYLKTDKETRVERYKERGSNQNQKWLEGRETKVSNILSNLNLLFCIEKYENNNTEDQNKVYEYIMSLIGDKTNV